MIVAKLLIGIIVMLVVGFVIAVFVSLLMKYGLWTILGLMLLVIAYGIGDYLVDN